MIFVAVVFALSLAAIGLYDASRSYCAACRRPWALFAAPSTLDPTKRCWRCWRAKVI